MIEVDYSWMIVVSKSTKWGQSFGEWMGFSIAAAKVRRMSS